MKRYRLTAILFLLALLVGGLGWTIYAPVRQTDKRVHEHAPFFVYGLWEIKTLTE